MSSLPEPTGAVPAPPSVGRPSAAADKMRIRFGKGGALRLLGHQDLVRTFERLLRRADLPVRHSNGFHPKARIIFALSLPLGVIGCAEIVEIELDRPVPPEEVQARLTAGAPPDLHIQSVERIDLRTSARVRSLSYALPVPACREQAVAQRIVEVLSADTCRVLPVGAVSHRPARDIRPFLRDLRLCPMPASSGQQAEMAPASPPSHFLLEMELWLCPGGTAHPHQVLHLLELQDLLEAGCVLERTRLELVEEAPAIEKGIA